MHIIDQIHNESEKLNSLTKEYIEKEDINTLEKIKSSNGKLRKLLQDYDKLLKEEAEIYGDLPNILSEKDSTWDLIERRREEIDVKFSLK